MKRSLRWIAALLLCVPVARGHPARAVKAEEMAVLADRVVLRVSYHISEPRFTTDLRERFDADADGALSAAERRALRDYVRMLALEDLRLLLDGNELRPGVELEAAGGLERALPSAYPLDFAWKLEFRLPPSGAETRVLELQDREARWNSPFRCRVVIGSAGEARFFDFPAGRGSFRIRLPHG
jgi:hypothetical protein